MASAAYPGGASSVVTGANVDTFIPELWSDEVVASFQSNLVVANLVTNMDHRGKKGDKVNVPAPYRGSTAAKAAATAVTIQANSEDSIGIDIDQHWEYSRLIEDIASIQALGSARAFYTADAGYQMAKTHDQFLALNWHRFNGGNMTAATFDQTAWETGYIGSTGATLFSSASGGNGTALADAGIRAIIQKLDDNDVPMSDRVLVIPPVTKAALLGIDRFTEQAFVGEAGAGNSIRNGMVGNVYGVKVYVSTNCPVIHCNSVTNESTTNFSTAALSGTSVSGSFTDFGYSTDTQDWDTTSPTDTQYRACAMFHKSALVLCTQAGVRSQTQYKQEYLADLFTVDSVFGGQGMRVGASNAGESATAGYSIIVPA